MSANRLLPVHVAHPSELHEGATITDLDGLAAAAFPRPWGAIGGGIIGKADTPIAALAATWGARLDPYMIHPDGSPALEWEAHARYYGGPLVCESMQRADAAFVVALVNAWPAMRENAHVFGAIIERFAMPCGHSFYDFRLHADAVGSHCVSCMAQMRAESGA